MYPLVQLVAGEDVTVTLEALGIRTLGDYKPPARAADAAELLCLAGEVRVFAEVVRSDHAQRVVSPLVEDGEVLRVRNLGINTVFG